MRIYLNEEMIIMIHTTNSDQCPTGNNMTLNNILYLHLTIHSVTYTCIAIWLWEFMLIVIKAI